jgi:hypothetical protein
VSHDTISFEPAPRPPVIRPALLALAAGLSAGVPPARPAHAGPFDGTWTLTPAFTTACTAGNVAVDVTVGRVFTKQVGADSLEITSDVAVTGQGMTHLDIYALKLRIDPSAGRFTFAGPVKGSVRREGFSGSLAGRLRVNGGFVARDSIRAQVRTTLTMKVTTPGGVSSGLCTPVDTTIVATRSAE